jgi:hypothetical protein
VARDSEWTAKRIDQLYQAWTDKQASVAECGREGAEHWPARPSPIIHGGRISRRHQPRRAGKATLPPLGSVSP